MLVFRKIFILSLLVLLGACNLSDSGQTFNGDLVEPDMSVPDLDDPVCDTDELVCDNECTDVMNDPLNCGDCGISCDTGQVCGLGNCVFACEPSEIVCDGMCINPASNADYCGASGDCQGANRGQACPAACVNRACACFTANPGAAISTISGTATEGGPAVTYTAVLTHVPCHTVSIEIITDAQVRTEPETLEFTVDNWNQVQTVRVFAILDNVIEGEHTSEIQHEARSDDPAYDGLSLDNVLVTIEDEAPVWRVVLPEPPNAELRNPRVSDDGRFVAFRSNSTNLLPEPIETDFSQLYLHDRETGETRLITRAANGEVSDGTVAGLDISSDGQLIVFASTATNLPGDALGDTLEIYLYRASDGSITQLSDTCPDCDARQGDGTISMTADGTKFVFTTRKQLLPEDLSTEYSVYLFDIPNGTLRLVSLNSNDEYPVFYWGRNVFLPRLSSNGRFLSMHSAARNLVPNPDLLVQNFHGYFRDLATGEVRRVSVTDDMQTPCHGVHQATSTSAPFMDNSGTAAAFDTLCPVDDTTMLRYPARQIILRDDASENNLRITRIANGEPATGDSFVRGLSSDGEILLFSSEAFDLDFGQPNNPTQALHLYIYETSTADFRVANIGRGFRPPVFGLLQNDATLSHNGRFVAYVSAEDMLSSQNPSQPEDVAIYVFGVR